MKGVLLHVDIKAYLMTVLMPYKFGNHRGRLFQLVATWVDEFCRVLLTVSHLPSVGKVSTEHVLAEVFSIIAPRKFDLDFLCPKSEFHLTNILLFFSFSLPSGKLKAEGCFATQGCSFCLLESTTERRG